MKKGEISSNDGRMLYVKCPEMHCLVHILSHCNWLFLSGWAYCHKCSSCKTFQIVAKSAHRPVFGKTWVEIWVKGDISRLWKGYYSFFSEAPFICRQLLLSWTVKPSKQHIFPVWILAAVNSSSLFLLFSLSSAWSHPWTCVSGGHFFPRELEISVLGGYPWKHSPFCTLSGLNPLHPCRAYPHCSKFLLKMTVSIYSNAS